MADAVGQQAYQLLVSGDTASAPASARLNERSSTIVAALVQGDVRLLREALGPGSPDSASVTQQETALMMGRRERLGAFQSVEVLGTVVGQGGELLTTVRINFANGAATNIYSWNREGFIMDVGARPFAATELIASANGEFRAFDARTGRGVRLVFANGSATAVTSSGSVMLTVQR